jgi:hypothetical protein
MKTQLPLCPVCGEAVPPGVPVIFDHGDMVHFSCYDQSAGAVAPLSDFLRSRRGDRFCFTCLSRRLGHDRQVIENAVAALRLDASFVVSPAFCSMCAHARVTVCAKPADPLS